MANSELLAEVTFRLLGKILKNPRVTGNPFLSYPEQAAVPETLRLQLRTLWLKGAKTEHLAATFKLPLEWARGHPSATVDI